MPSLTLCRERAVLSRDCKNYLFLLLLVIIVIVCVSVFCIVSVLKKQYYQTRFLKIKLYIFK